ncbi:MAG: DUF6529 family protein [Dermatophilaceae bacterium]
MSSSEIQTRRSSRAPQPFVAVGIPVLAGCAVALALGVYGSVHQPAGYAVSLAGFSGGLAAKAWLTTAALLLGVVQVVTAAGMWGRLGLADRTWTAPVHRWAGRAAVLLTLPVVVHCLYALGVDHSSPRTLAHSVLGAFFFGAFTTKMLSLARPGVPQRTLPLVGGLLFAALVGIWLTSALWFFTTFGLVR